MEVQMTRALDCLVAERLFGWQWAEDDGDRVLIGPVRETHQGRIEPRYWPNRSQRIPADDDPWGMPGYSTSIAAAWQIVEKMREKPPRPNGYMDDSWVSVFIEVVDGHDCDCSIIETWQTSKGNNNRGLGESGLRNEIMATVPLAICIAALRAVGTPEDEIQRALEVGG